MKTIQSNYDKVTGTLHSLIIELENGNLLQIEEMDENSVQIRNATHITDDQLGLMLETIEYGAINIIPEG